MKYFIIAVLFTSCCKQVERKPEPGKEPTITDSVVSVYIFAGQSNCGRAKWSGATADEKKEYGGALLNVKIFNGIFKYVPLQAGINTRMYDYHDTTEMGAEVSFAHNLTGQNCIIKVGCGNTSLAGFWMPYHATGYLYLRDAVRQALDSVRANGKVPVLKAFIWIQGESDSVDSTMAANYFMNLTRFFIDFNSWYKTMDTAVSHFKTVIAEVNGIDDPQEIYREQVRSAQHRYCDSTGAILINTDSYPMQDVVHYSIAGQLEFGNDIFNKIK